MKEKKIWKKVIALAFAACFALSAFACKEDEEETDESQKGKFTFETETREKYSAAAESEYSKRLGIGQMARKYEKYYLLSSSAFSSRLWLLL